jgi:hypothetical protein
MGSNMASGSRSDRNSHIIDDDDDVSLSFLDGLGDEEPPTPPKGADRKPSYGSGRPSAPAAKSEPPSTSSKKQGEGYDRIQYYRALQGFLQALVEASPLYLGELLRNPELSDAELRSKVGTACKEHLALVDLCLKVNDADAGDIMLRYQRRSLAKNLAGLYRTNKIEDVQGLVEISQQWMLSSSDFENASADYNSADNVLNVRLGLFVAALKSQLSLESMWCSFTPSEVTLKLQKIAIGMANELAFNWSTRSQITDKENLFQTSLPHCLEIAEHAYREMAIKELPPIEYLYTDPDMKLSRFEDAVEDMDVGYVGADREALYIRARAIVKGLFGKFTTPPLSFTDTCRWYSAYIAEIDMLLARSWNDAANTFLTEMHSLSPEAVARFAEENPVLDSSRFFEKFMERLDDLEPPLSDVEIDFDKVGERARRHLAWLWGISDSLIAARNEGVPEEFT